MIPILLERAYFQEFESILAALSWQQLFSLAGLLFDPKPRPISQNLYLRCIFHCERTPSLVLRQDSSWACYGCHRRGIDKIDFCRELAARRNIDLTQAPRLRHQLFPMSDISGQIQFDFSSLDP